MQIYDRKEDSIQKKTLQKFIKAKNICEFIDDDKLSSIGSQAINDYEIDLNCEKRAKKQEKWTNGADIVEQVLEQKNTPFENASNFKHPLMTVAAIQYNAHTLPAIMNDGEPVKLKVVGDDKSSEKENFAKKPVDYMNYQLTEEITEWACDTDKLILLHSLYGVMYRKIWYSPHKQRICTKILTPEKLILPSNYESMEDTPRSSEIIYLYPNEIETQIRLQLFCEFDYQTWDEDHASNSPIEFIEQHCWLDLDEDGYQEPYILTIHKQSSTVCRIVANYSEESIVFSEKNKNKVVLIKKTDYYVEYPFIPNLTGKGLPCGFFDILYPLNEGINTNINQLFDAGTLQNSNSGFIGKDAKIGKGSIKLKIGSYLPVQAYGNDIRKSIVPMNFQGPSPVLFQLLGFMVETGKEIANIKDILSGESYANMPAATAMTLVEQGTKVYSAIFTRIYNSLSKEFKILKRLNYHYVNTDHYVEVIDSQVSREDFEDPKLTFIPVADPKRSTTAQKLAESQFLMQFINDPFINPLEIRKRILESASIGQLDQLLMQPSQEPSMQDQILQIHAENEQLKLRIRIMEMQEKQKETQSKIAKNEASALKDKTAAIDNLASAEAKEVGSQLDIYRQEMESLNEDNERRVRSVDRKPRDTGSIMQSSGNEGIDNKSMGVRSV